ncbi:MAG: YfiR family protein, partial [Verrucomicrobia bacterium]|nr:YfiR family protein [Verrucomicrobiota bacterium]
MIFCFPLLSGLRRVRLILAALLAGVGVQAAGTAPHLTSTEVEAVFLFNFAQFVAWPAASFPDAQAPLVIGVLGKDPFGSILDDVVHGEKVKGRPILIRRFSRVQDVDRCQILFISQSENDRLTQDCAALKSRPVLTVSDIKDFAQRGGMIEFVQEKERIRFRIALQRARSESIEISAKLLRPAEVVFHFNHNFEVAMRNFPVPEPSAVRIVGGLLAPTLIELMRLSLEQNVSLA